MRVDSCSGPASLEHPGRHGECCGDGGPGRLGCVLARHRAVRTRVAETRWVWALPFVLSIDNITFGLIDHAWSSSVAVQAIEQLVSSSLLALIGLLASAAVLRAIRARSSGALLSRPRSPGLRASSPHRSCSPSANRDGNLLPTFWSAVARARVLARAPLAHGRRRYFGARVRTRRRPVVLIGLPRPPAPSPRLPRPSITSLRSGAATAPRRHASIARAAGRLR